MPEIHAYTTGLGLAGVSKASRRPVECQRNKIIISPRIADLPSSQRRMVGADDGDLDRSNFLAYVSCLCELQAKRSWRVEAPDD